MDGDNQRERFDATSGRVLGVLGVLVGLALLVPGLVATPVSWGLASIGLLVVAVSWAALLRPAVTIDGDDLVLRGMASSVTIPLAAVEQVAVRQVLAVRAGERRYTCPAVGRGRREMAREDRGAGSVGDEQSYGKLVEDRIRAAASAARASAGVRIASAEQAALASGVRRHWSPPDLVLLVGSVVAVVLAAVL